MPTTCVIDFEDNPVYSGQLLRGTVELNLSKEKNVRGVYIDLCGKGYASWTENNGRYQQIYTTEEIYLNERIYFVGGSEEVRLSSGIHNYDFEFNLRSTLPTSIEGECGHIRYTARVVLDNSLWPSKIIVQPFAVIKPIDLNIFPILRKPIIFEKTNILTRANWLCWLYSDPIKLTVHIPLSGYCPGQFINVEVNVINQTGQSISDILVKLIRKVTMFQYANNNRQKTEIFTITKTKADGCDKYQNKVIRAKIQVPETPPTELSSSKIFKIRYVIRVIAMTSSYWCSAAIFDIPITIGTHPIQENATENIASIPNVSASVLSDNGILSESFTSQSDVGDAPPYSPPPNFPIDDFLPTYEEAIILNDADGKIFKPKYFMFKRSTSYSSEAVL